MAGRFKDTFASVQSCKAAVCRRSPVRYSSRVRMSKKERRRQCELESKNPSASPPAVYRVVAEIRTVRFPCC